MLSTAFILARISIVGNLQFPSSSIHPQIGVVLRHVYRGYLQLFIYTEETDN